MDGAGFKPRETIVALARACYKRLCPGGPPDLPVHKSIAMQAFIEGTVLSEQMLSRERDIWHFLHLGLNKELGAYHELIEKIYALDLDEREFTMETMHLIGEFRKSNARLKKIDNL